MNKLFLIFVFLFVACGKPVDLRNDDSYGRAGFTSWGKSQDVTTASGTFIGKSNNTVNITATGGDNAPKLFPFGSMLVITCGADARGYWLMDSGVTTSTTGYQTDAGSTKGSTTGFGGSFHLEAGVPRHVIVPTPFNGDIENDQVSQRSLSCGHATASTNSKVRGYPCDAVADCFYASSTCNATNPPIAGSLLKIHPTADTNCAVDMER